MRSFRGPAKTSLGLMVVITLVVTTLVFDSRTEQAAVAGAASICSPGTPTVIGADGRSVSPRPQSVVQVWPTGAICEFEQRIIQQIATERGTPLTEQIRGEIMSYGRNEVRGRMFVQLLGLLDRDPGSLDEVERGALDWFVDRYRELRLNSAQNARDEYDRWLDEQCDYEPPEGFTHFGGRCSDLLSLFTTPDPPKYDEFVRYGVAITSAELFNEPKANEILAALLNATVKSAIFGTGTVLSIVVLNSVASLVTKAIFPFVKGAVSPLKFAGPVGLIVGVVVISIIRGIDIVNQAQIPSRLDSDITIAASIDSPQAAAALTSEGGLSELALAFLNATSPDYPDPPSSVVPPATPPSDAPLWVLKDANVPPTLSDSPTFTMMGLDNSINRVWMKDGWFVVQPIEPSGPIRLDPVLSFWNSQGFPTTAQFVDGRFLVESFSSYGNQPTECRLPACALTLDIEHLVVIDGAPTPRTATYAGFAPQITSGPTVTGNLEVGSEVTFEVVATDVETAELDYEWTVSRGSVHDDGTATQTYRTRTPRHRWAGAGTYVISVVVTDEAGAQASAATTVEVSSVPTDLSVRTQYFFNGEFRDLPLRQNEGGRIVVDSTESGVCLSVDWQSNGVVDVSQFVDGNSATFDTPADLPAGIVPTQISAVSESCENDEEIGRGTFPLEVRNSPPTDIVIELLDPDPARGWRESSDGDASDLPTFVEGSSIPVRVSARDHPTDQLTFVAVWEPGGEIDTRWLLFDQHPPGSDGTSTVEATLAAVDQRDIAWLIVYVSDGDQVNFDVAYYRIVNAEPVIESYETTADQFGNIGLQVRVSDPGNAQREIERISIDWGDGTEPDDLDIEFSFAGEPLEVDVAGVGAHRYSTSGTYTATVTAFDDVTSVQQTIEISVPEFTPVISDIATLDIGVAGEETTLAVVVDDPDTDPTELDVDVDWGDGSTSPAAYDPTWEPPAFVARHTYGEPGTYGVTVTAVDPGPDREAAVLDGEITVLRRPLSVTVDQGASQLDPTSDSTIIFDVEFSEPVTGFDADDVVVSGTAGASLVNVVDSGDGTAFVVEVSGMSRTGTVSADVLAGAAFTEDGVPNSASTSTDNEVLYIRPIEFELPGIDGVVTVENEPGRAGAVVEFEASATGGMGVPAVVCVPASGSFFGLGTTEVTCVAGDSTATTRTALRAESSGTGASASFQVRVNDTEAPRIEPFVDVTATSTDGNPVNVEFSAPNATDNSGSVTVECLPASSSLFALGVTTVTCTAVDASGNSATSLGTVTVTASGSPGATDPDPAQPPAEDAVQPPVLTLPSTGTSLGGTILAALTLLMMGLVLVRGRRRPHPSS